MTMIIIVIVIITVYYYDYYYYDCICVNYVNYAILCGTIHYLSWRKRKQKIGKESKRVKE